MLSLRGLLNYEVIVKEFRKGKKTLHLSLPEWLEWVVRMGLNISNNCAALHFCIDLQDVLKKKQPNRTTKLNFQSLDLDKCVRSPQCM